MNSETVALEEAFIKVLVKSRLARVSALAMTKAETARLLLKECKDSGLRWYDGENDKWKEIE